VVVQEIVNPLVDIIELQSMSKRLRFFPTGNVEEVSSAWNLINMLLTHDSPHAEVLQRVYLTLNVIYVELTAEMTQSDLDSLIRTNPTMVILAAIYNDDTELLRHVIRVGHYEEGDVDFSKKVFMSCICLDKIEVVGKLVDDALIRFHPSDLLGLDLLYYLVSPQGFSGGEYIEKSPFSPSNIGVWFDFIIGECGWEIDIGLFGHIAKYGNVQMMKYVVEKRRILTKLLKIKCETFDNFFSAIDGIPDRDDEIVEYLRNLPYVGYSVPETLVDACRFDELEFVRESLESPGRDWNIEECEIALEDPSFTLPRMHTNEIRSFLHQRCKDKSEHPNERGDGTISTCVESASVITFITPGTPARSLGATWRCPGAIPKGTSKNYKPAKNSCFNRRYCCY
jgi:hypothetical protein